MANERFHDHFSRASADYVATRPTYPRELYEFIASLTPSHDRCWDCATGSGQAAVALTEHFGEVIATDGSAEQLSHAAAHERVTYREALASASGIEAASVDAVTVAAALHWFANDDFYSEVRRVAKPTGVLAAWSYGPRLMVTKEIDNAVIRFGGEVLGPYWPPEFLYNVSGYETLPFPFETIDGPSFSAVVTWDLGEMMQNISTWSSYGRYTEAKGRSPQDELESALVPAWGDPTAKREVRWPLHYKIGRVR